MNFFEKNICRPRADKKLAKMLARAISKKLLGKHPTKKEMIAIARALPLTNIEYSAVLYYGGGHPVKEFGGLGYYDFIVLKIRSPISESVIKISSLPWKEILEAVPFDEVRYRDDGEPVSDEVLNDLPEIVSLTNDYYDHEGDYYYEDEYEEFAEI